MPTVETPREPVKPDVILEHCGRLSLRFRIAGWKCAGSGKRYQPTDLWGSIAIGMDGATYGSWYESESSARACYRESVDYQCKREAARALRLLADHGIKGGAL